GRPGRLGTDVPGVSEATRAGCGRLRNARDVRVPWGTAQGCGRYGWVRAGSAAAGAPRSSRPGFSPLGLGKDGPPTLTMLWQGQSTEREIGRRGRRTEGGGRVTEGARGHASVRVDPKP